MNLRIATLTAASLSALMTQACGEDRSANGCTIDRKFVEAVAIVDSETLGLSGQDLIARLDQRRGRLTWQDGRETAITVGVTAVGASAEAYAPPSGAGYCERKLTVDDVTLEISTGDGDLAEQLMGSLVATVSDGEVESAFVAADPLEVEVLAGTLQVPEELEVEGHTVRRLRFEIDFGAAEALSAHCRAGEAATEDPADRCNRFDGVVRYSTSTPDAFEHHHDIDRSKYRSSALGWWRWDPP